MTALILVTNCSGYITNIKIPNGVFFLYLYHKDNYSYDIYHKDNYSHDIYYKNILFLIM